VRTAIALSYPEYSEAPIIVARGREALADRMLAIAHECGIRIINDQVLTDILSETEIGSCIPESAYEAVAAIFAFLDRGIAENWFY